MSAGTTPVSGQHTRGCLTCGEGDVQRIPAVAFGGGLTEIHSCTQIRAVFFQFGEHAHSERHGGADSFGPAV
jgi:hypothetical protein